MTVLRTHLSVIEAGAIEYKSRPAFKIPSSSPTTESVWKTVTFAEFQTNVEASAQRWARYLSQQGHQSQSVIGIWLNFDTYTDLVTVFGISRAGFIPQLLSPLVCDPAVLVELLGDVSAVAVIVDPAFQALSPSRSLPVYQVVNPSAVDELGPASPADLPVDSLEPEQVVMIFQTSGSTSGVPKNVPYTAGWIHHSLMKTQMPRGALPGPSEEEVGIVSSPFHFASAYHIVLGLLAQGGCTVIPRSMPVTVTELGQMVSAGTLTHLTLIATIVSQLIEAAQQDKCLLVALQRLRQVVYVGAPLNQHEIDWALEHGICLKSGFASTEVGAMMISTGRSKTGELLFQPLPNTLYEFCPVEGDSSEREAGGSSYNLLELVVPLQAGDCPHPSLRSAEDRKFHTRDLFEEVSPGKYLNRGRNDDFIKVANAKLFDARYMAEKAIETCGNDLIESAIAIGAGRASPVLVVESKAGTHDRDGGLRAEVYGRMLPHTSKGFIHERIADISHVLVAPPLSLPRAAAKGNIIRKAVEEVYKEQLDGLFSLTPT